MASIALKVSLLGDYGVGKTAYTQRLFTGHFPMKYVPTTEKSVACVPFRTNKGLIFLNFSEGTRGEDQNQPADVYIIMFDVGRDDTYKNLEKWLKIIPQNSLVIVCGNKVDLKQRTVHPKDIRFPLENGLEYFDISAKVRYNLDKPVLCLLRKVFGEDLMIL